MGDAIVRRACGGHQRRELDEGFDRYEDGTNGQGGTRHTIGHPDGNRGRPLIVLAEPDVTAMPHAALYGDRLAVQWMPRIVNRDLLSVVGRM